MKFLFIVLFLFSGCGYKADPIYKEKELENI
jgi:hypothetical protein